MHVDIISMSWTFLLKDCADEQLALFKNAIQAASKEGIILLNSLDDDITDVKDLFPTSCTDVIRIGSATKWGDKAPHTKRGSAHYLFPGHDITNTDGLSMNGSSFATAFAAGLAGLIIFTMRALPCIDPSMSDNEKQTLRKATRPMMEQAFKILGGKSNEASPVDVVVEPRAYFPKDPEADADGKGMPQVLVSFLTRLQILP